MNGIRSLKKVEIGVLKRRFGGERDFFIVEYYPFTTFLQVRDIVPARSIPADVRNHPRKRVFANFCILQFRLICSRATGNFARKSGNGSIQIVHVRKQPVCSTISRPARFLQGDPDLFRSKRSQTGNKRLDHSLVDSSAAFGAAGFG